ncbi:MAG: ABC transporter permease [Gracilibacteraceae bacterium]|jgi:ABC-2 type transport system permease protein|nr:ABC transporter permease [Gracilibacteraceae bacterium]
MMRGNFDNTGRLVRLILRRERIMSVIWLAMLLLFSVGLAPGLGIMFDEEARSALIDMVENPAMVAMVGPVYGVDNYTAGAMYANMMLLWVVISVAVMNIFLVVRHTRGDEERGRTEVVRSLPTGRLSNLNATMITAVLVNTALALLTGLGIGVMRIDSMDFVGSMLYGVALGASGLVFAAIAALFSQLSSSSRGATGLSIGALFVFYIMRAAGDMNSEALSLASPLGLVARGQIYVENHWWPIIILLLEAAVIMAVAYALNAIRDMDQGFIHARPGRKKASNFLQSPFGLTFRLLRNVLLAWIIAIFVLGASYGSILGDIDNFVANSDFYAMMIGANLEFTTAQMFGSMVISIMALITVIAVLMVTLRLRGEEKDGRAEHVLSRVVSRMKYMSGYVVLALAASVLAQLATALGIYLSALAVLPDPGDLSLGYLLKANMVFLPALWVMMGVTVFLIGILPKATPVIWGYYGFTFFAVFIGRIPDLLPAWVPKTTPFGYIPQLPVDSINYGTLAVLTGIAAVLTVAGFVFYRKRDMAAI